MLPANFCTTCHKLHERFDCEMSVLEFLSSVIPVPLPTELLLLIISNTQEDLCRFCSKMHQIPSFICSNCSNPFKFCQETRQIQSRNSNGKENMKSFGKTTVEMRVRYAKKFVVLDVYVVETFYKCVKSAGSGLLIVVI
ncbi:hypothetical protein BCR33DRAFT_132160 [Rhizoclosmatium globosum]|uniref:Uncharacterized protein n=1 Tax=Rhizoclosmatium globosum TaxID=329046 RepID=A0A1Y2CHT6_9FUNG|nr:hypothetical protein BCR33DRAFT_132160 [Rhizoclosmatium globosum]|eukprot:ORY46613.1 hypothetical protein BCR33DRAFT_132160 [Rhizoclosmatium globosum]